MAYLDAVIPPEDFVEATASYSSWVRGQPRLLAVALGTAASLELGDGKKALGFLSSVLKYDPDRTRGPAIERVATLQPPHRRAP